MKVKIEKNVPIPSGGESIYPWDRLKVGESFVVPGFHAHSMARRRSVKGKKFTARKISKKDGSHRVWRIE